MPCSMAHRLNTTDQWPESQGWPAPQAFRGAYTAEVCYARVPDPYHQTPDQGAFAWTASEEPGMHD